MELVRLIKMHKSTSLYYDRRHLFEGKVFTTSGYSEHKTGYMVKFLHPYEAAQVKRYAPCWNYRIVGDWELVGDSMKLTFLLPTPYGDLTVAGVVENPAEAMGWVYNKCGINLTAELKKLNGRYK